MASNGHIVVPIVRCCTHFATMYCILIIFAFISRGCVCARVRFCGFCAKRKSALAMCESDRFLFVDCGCAVHIIQKFGPDRHKCDDLWTLEKLVERTEWGWGWESIRCLFFLFVFFFRNLCEELAMWFADGPHGEIWAHSWLRCDEYLPKTE